MLTLVCSFVHVQMETQICGNSGYDPPPLTHALLSFACFTLRSGTLTLFFFGHVDEWALDDFSAHLNGTFVCSSTAYFHVTFMNSRYVQIEVCYKHRNSHISGMRNGLLTSFFSFFVQGVRLASPSSLLPAEPFSKGLVLYVCFAHLAQVRVETNNCVFPCASWRLTSPL